MRLSYWDACPDLVYKYCSRDVYERFLKQGTFRVGTLHEYRRAFEEKGAEFGDYIEGNETLLFKGPIEIGGSKVSEQGAFIVDRFENAFVCSTATEYTAEAHNIWKEREGCGYDICVVLKAREFFEQLARQIHKRKSGVKIFAAKPIYSSAIIDAQKEPPKKGDIFRYKSPSLEWEKEYRLVAVDPTLSPKSVTPLIARSFRLEKCIVDVKVLS